LQLEVVLVVMIEGMPDPGWRTDHMVEEERRIVAYLRSRGLCKFWDMVGEMVVGSDHDRSTWLRLASRMTREGKIRRTRTGFVRLRENYGKDQVRDAHGLFDWSKHSHRKGWKNHLPTGQTAQAAETSAGGGAASAPGLDSARSLLATVCL
jgi:hypothetical protein